MNWLKHKARKAFGVANYEFGDNFLKFRKFKWADLIWRTKMVKEVPWLQNGFSGGLLWVAVYESEVKIPKYNMAAEKFKKSPVASKWVHRSFWGRSLRI